jgi:hypothetical protein
VLCSRVHDPKEDHPWGALDMSPNIVDDDALFRLASFGSSQHWIEMVLGPSCVLVPNG